MADNFDLFGDPVPEGRGRRGRPQHVPTQENRNKVSMLLALGWSNERIAASLRITQPSLRKHYFSELKFREVARDRLVAAQAMILWKEVEKGNITAMREFQSFLERNDLMLFGQTTKPQQQAQPKEQKLGKKEEALLAAQQPDAGTPLGDLMARRAQQGGDRPN